MIFQNKHGNMQCSILIEIPYKCFYINSFSLLGILMCSVCH